MYIRAGVSGIIPRMYYVHVHAHDMHYTHAQYTIGQAQVVVLWAETENGRPNQQLAYLVVDRGYGDTPTC